MGYGRCHARERTSPLSCDEHRRPDSPTTSIPNLPLEGSRDELVRRGLALKDLGVDAVMPRGVRTREELAFFRQAVPGVPLLVIAGADDIAVQEYADLGYQIIIYATTPAVVAASALLETYQHLKDTGRLNLTAQRVAEFRRLVEELISLLEYYAVEVATTEKASVAATEHP